MKRPGLAWVVMVVALACGLSGPSRALAGSPQLSIREIKITGDEFLVIQNSGNAGINHLSDYWIGYVGSDTLTAPPVQQLPDYPLDAGAVFLLSGGGTTTTCDASLLGKLSPTLSDSKGSLALWQQKNDSFVLLPGSQSQVKWNKTTTTFTVPAGEIDLKNETNQYADPVWFYGLSDTWRVGDFSNCLLTTYVSAADTTGSTAANWPPSSAQPPATIVSLASEDEMTSTGLPAADAGLSAPQISELLPNPAGTGTDDTDEFIELYNPNDRSFDLNGFVLESGLTTKHKYTFDSGTSIPAKSFIAFYSADTGLTLSNTSGQAALLDPLGNTVSQSDQYSSAKDGQSWSLADGKWYWTNTPTPNDANSINQLSTLNNAKAAGKSSSKSGSVQGASTPTALSSNLANDNVAPVSVHPWTLAAVGVAALLYGCYEYRTDLSNHLYRLRRYIKARRTAGK